MYTSVVKHLYLRNPFPYLVILFIYFYSIGNEASPFIVSPQAMMVAPMQTAYGNFPQPAAQHFQPQSPVYASQVIHPTMMVQDPMVRIVYYNSIHRAYEISVIVLCRLLIANSVNILYMSPLFKCSCVFNSSSNHQGRLILFLRFSSVMLTRLHCTPTSR